MARQGQTKLEEALPRGWRGPWDDYVILHGGSLSDRTTANYLDTLVQLAKFVGGSAPNLEDLNPRIIARFLAYTAENASPVTAGMRYRGLRAVFNALTRKDEDGEALLARNPMAGVQPPRVVEPELPVIDIEDIRKVIAKIREHDKIEDLRDEALIRFLFATGCRRGEVTSMRIDPQALNLREGTASVTGKTGPRVVQFDSKTTKALFRYTRARRHLKHADSPMLWLSHRGPLTGNGIFQAVSQRFANAGITIEHAVHAFRHTFSHQWQLRGGQVTDLISANGWSAKSGPAMALRYGRSASQERARAAAKIMNLGSLI
jgi:site-specific recombinase XerD